MFNDILGHLLPRDFGRVEVGGMGEGADTFLQEAKLGSVSDCS